jgi:D-beta-D-heptose 7-phosphate kinase/D-beta-D-heptose 1-phosphate adenosyltransferase
MADARSGGPSRLAELAAERRLWREAGRGVVLTNGCFDLLHPGHLALLEAARREGDVLVVALNSDVSVRGLKGGGRPVVPEAERAELLLALEAVDRVVLYDEPTPIAVVRALRPDVLVKGADWAADAIVGRSEVEGAGGRVVRVAILPGRSSSSIIDRIRRP